MACSWPSLPGLGHRLHAHAASRPTRADHYERRRPEDGVLYQVVREHWPVVHERAEEQGGLQKFIVREFEELRRVSTGTHETSCPGQRPAFAPVAQDS